MGLRVVKIGVGCPEIAPTRRSTPYSASSSLSIELMNIAELLWLFWFEFFLNLFENSLLMRDLSSAGHRNFHFEIGRFEWHLSRIPHTVSVR